MAGPRIYRPKLISYPKSEFHWSGRLPPVLVAPRPYIFHAPLPKAWPKSISSLIPSSSSWDSEIPLFFFLCPTIGSHRLYWHNQETIRETTPSPITCFVGLHDFFLSVCSQDLQGVYPVKSYFINWYGINIFSSSVEAKIYSFSQPNICPAFHSEARTSLM